MNPEEGRGEWKEGEREGWKIRNEGEEREDEGRQERKGLSMSALPREDL